MTCACPKVPFQKHVCAYLGNSVVLIGLKPFHIAIQHDCRASRARVPRHGPRGRAAGSGREQKFRPEQRACLVLVDRPKDSGREIAPA
eukprot:5332869-Prymnesium_polylepis.2